jgi:trimeric autotransporter adhesin
MRLHAFTLRFARLLMVSAGLAGTATELTAQTTVFHACYVPLTGTVYRIKETSLKQACASASHVEFTWTDGVGAIRSGDAAGGDLGGLFPDPTVVALLGRALSTTAPTAGQVLTFDGTEWVPVTPTGGGGAPVDHGALGGLADDDHPQYLLAHGARDVVDGFAVTGTLGLGSIPVEGSGVRMMWYPRKAAFRAGAATTSWDDANVGMHSVAMGSGTTASGEFSTALGNGTLASGGNATALGVFTIASNFNATAMGRRSQATGFNATAIGNNTVASGASATAMGENTIASGDFSTAIGVGTIASGARSVAIGSHAEARADGSFVFADASSTTGIGLINVGPNFFLVRAHGGAEFVSGRDPDGFGSTGVHLSPGAGAWSTLSDVNRKHLFRDEEAERVLAQVADLPIRSWSYKTQDSRIRHLGPTAQDFHAAFGLGENDTRITTTDIDGVALLAIQALEARTRDLRERTAEVEKLRERVRLLEATTLRLEAAVTELMKAIDARQLLERDTDPAHR